MRRRSATCCCSRTCGRSFDGTPAVLVEMTMLATIRRDAPIGVFDSGVGGLTVLRALSQALPAQDFIYLGDTARLPYGTKSPDTVARYSLQCAQALLRRGIGALAVACNTASASALGALSARYPGLPVIGVLEPG